MSTLSEGLLSRDSPFSLLEGTRDWSVLSCSSGCCCTWSPPHNISGELTFPLLFREDLLLLLFFLIVAVAVDVVSFSTFSFNGTVIGSSASASSITSISWKCNNLKKNNKKKTEITSMVKHDNNMLLPLFVLFKKIGSVTLNVI